VLDIVIVYLVLWWFDDAYDPGVHFYEVAIGVGLVWVASLAFSLRSWLWTLISLWAIEPKLMRGTFLELLRANRLPSPRRLSEPARFDYLTMLANDESLDVTDRLKAATIFGVWTGVMKARGGSAAFAIGQAWDAAIKQYDDEMPYTKSPAWTGTTEHHA
jgi:hypothetical protein